MKIVQVEKTATVAWSPSYYESASLLLATGSVSGALDASFSMQSQLELHRVEFVSSRQTLACAYATQARFNALAWTGAVKRMGILAGGMEDGSLNLWDPAHMLSSYQPPPQKHPSSSPPSSSPTAIQESTADNGLLWHKQAHSGNVKALDFNPNQPNLLATGSAQAEIFVWDLNNPEKPYTPGARSNRLDDISCLAWNRQVPHILASGSNNGIAVIWDLKHRREIIHLAAPSSSTSSASSSSAGRPNVGAIAWNPSVATQVLTASEDDANPVIYVWDLRNAHAPERILKHHTKGVLSLSWCQHDSDLLMSSGKDNRVLCWNPRSAELIGEFPPARNWVFDVKWCDRNPDLVATASFDGKIRVHSLQGSTDTTPLSPVHHQHDPFASHGFTMGGGEEFRLKQPPQWVRRPCGARFSFGNRLVGFTRNELTVSTPPPAAAAHSNHSPSALTKTREASHVTVWQVQSDGELARRATALHQVIMASADAISEYCLQRAQQASSASSSSQQQQQQQQHKQLWEFMALLQQSDSRKKILDLLGYTKGAVLERMAQLNLSSNSETHKRSDQPPGSAKTSGADDQEVDDNMTALFSADANGEDFAVGTDAALGAAQNTPLSPSPLGRADSFELLPDSVDVHQVDEWIVQAIVGADFVTATELCVRLRRLDDALVLGALGGDEALAYAKRAYFKLRLSKQAYVSDEVRVHRYHSILKSLSESDLGTLVMKQDISKWKEVLGLICTFASESEIASLCRALGDRLWACSERLAASSSGAGSTARPEMEKKEYEVAAVMCLMASGDVERVQSIWTDEFEKQVQPLVQAMDAGRLAPTSMSEYGRAVQALVEKVTVLKHVTGQQFGGQRHSGETQGKHGGQGQGHAQDDRVQHAGYARVMVAYVCFLVQQGLLELALDALCLVEGSIAPIEVLMETGVGEGQQKQQVDLVKVWKYGLYYSMDVSLLGRFSVPEAPFESVNVTAGGGASAVDGGQPRSRAEARRDSKKFFDDPTQQQRQLPTPQQQPMLPPQQQLQQQQRQQQQQLPPVPVQKSPIQGAWGGSSMGMNASSQMNPPATTTAPAATGAGMGAWGGVSASQPIQQQQQYLPAGPAGMSPSSGYPGQQPPPMQQQPATQQQPQPTQSSFNPYQTGYGTSGSWGQAQGGYYQQQPTQSSPQQPQQLIGPPPVTTVTSPQQGHVHPSKPIIPAPAPLVGATGPSMVPNVTSNNPVALPPMANQSSALSSSSFITKKPTSGWNEPDAAMFDKPKPKVQAPAPPPINQAFSPNMSGGMGSGVPVQGMPPSGPQLGVPLQQQQQQPLPQPQQRLSRDGSQMGMVMPSPPGTLGQPPAPTSPVKAKHPIGDRTHIPPEHRPIYEILSKCLKHCKPLAVPAQKKILDDTEKKLNALFDKLNNADITSDAALSLLDGFVKALEAKKWQDALHVQQTLLTSHASEGTNWILGLKRLVEVASRLIQ